MSIARVILAPVVAAVVAAVGVAVGGMLLARGPVALAQETPAAATQPAADARPSALNAPGYEYPKVDSQGRATFRIAAPDAQSVFVSVGRRVPLTRGENGVWVGTSDPLPVGFH